MNDLCKNPMILCAIAGFVAAVLSFMDHRINSDDKFVPDYTRYLKIFVLVAGLSYGVLKISCRGCPSNNQSGGGSCPWKATAESASVATSIGEQIHTGNPNF